MLISRDDTISRTASAVDLEGGVVNGNIDLSLKPNRHHAKLAEGS